MHLCFNKSVYGGINLVCDVQNKICCVRYCNNEQKDIKLEYNIIIIFIVSNKLD
jgi:hypothetical protein